MRTFPFLHWFDALPPTLDSGEEEVWFRHPKYPLQCNQLGGIMMDDCVVGYTQVKNQIRIQTTDDLIQVLGYKEKIVMECYHQTFYSNYRFFHLDSNPLNFSEENLIGFRSKGPEYKELVKRENDFHQRSLEYMLEKTENLENKGIDPVKYWETLLTPPQLIRDWTLIYSPEFRQGPQKKRGPYSKPQSADRMHEIKQMRDLGMSCRKIAEELGVKRNTVRYWLQKIKKANDI